MLTIRFDFVFLGIHFLGLIAIKGHHIDSDQRHLSTCLLLGVPSVHKRMHYLDHSHHFCIVVVYLLTCIAVCRGRVLQYLQVLLFIVVMYYSTDMCCRSFIMIMYYSTNKCCRALWSCITVLTSVVDRLL